MFRPGYQTVWIFFSSGNIQTRNRQASRFKMIQRKLGHLWSAANLRNSGFGF